MLSDRRKGVMLSYISIIVSVLLSMVYTPYLLRQLGQAEYGLYSLVNTVMSYLTILDFGLGNTAIRYAAKYRELGEKDKESSLYGMFIVLYTIIGLVAFVGGSIISANANQIFAKTLEAGQENRVSIMIMIATFNVAISFPAGVFSSLIVGYEKYFFSKLMGLVHKIITPITMIGILFAGLGSIGLLSAATVISLVFNIIRMYYALKHLKIRVSFTGFEFSLFREIFGFSIFIFLSMIVDKIFWSTDQIVLGILGENMGEVASYSLASTFVSAFISVTSVIGHMYLPQFTKMVVRNQDEEIISNEFIRISRLQFFVCMMIYGFILILGKRFIVEVYAGAQYLDTYYICVIIISSLITGITQNVAISVIQAKNMHKFRAYIQLAIAILNLIFSIYAVHKYGAIGAAVVTFITHFLGIFIIMSIYYQKAAHLDILKLWRQLLKIIIKYSVLIIVFLILNELLLKYVPVWPYLIITGTSYLSLYLLITYFSCMNKSEKNIVKGFLNKFLKK